MSRYSIQIWHRDGETREERLTTVAVNSPTPLTDDQLDQRRVDAIAKLGNVLVEHSRIVPVPSAFSLGGSDVSSIDPARN